MAPAETPSIVQASAATAATGTVSPARVHQLAKQFEAMFMAEMLHQAHNKSHAVGVFKTGEAESTMQPFMDQALGEAIAARGGTGIAASIEQVLNRTLSEAK